MLDWSPSTCPLDGIHNLLSWVEKERVNIDYIARKKRKEEQECEVSIVIPARDEEECLGSVLDEVEVILQHFPFNCEVIVVNDRSTDRTCDIARQYSFVKLIDSKSKSGKGGALRSGFDVAKGSYIAMMDADFSHNPGEIPNFLNALKDYDLVLGSRYIEGVNVVNWPMRRLILSKFANIYSSFVTGMSIKDATGGYKAFRKEVLQAINLDEIKSNGYSFQIEMTFKAWKKGFKIKEISIVFVDKVKGTSKMSKKIVREAILMVWKLRFASMLGTLK